MSTNNCGIYCLKTVNSKLIYIGSSENLSIRERLHKSQIKHQDRKRGCSKVIDEVVKGDTYTFEILEYCRPLKTFIREQFWLNHYKNQTEYKLINVFDADREYSDVTEEFRERMSKIRKQAWKDGIYKKKGSE